MGNSMCKKFRFRPVKGPCSETAAGTPAAAAPAATNAAQQQAQASRSCIKGSTPAGSKPIGPGDVQLEDSPPGDWKISAVTGSSRAAPTAPAPPAAAVAVVDAEAAGGAPKSSPRPRVNFAVAPDPQEEGQQQQPPGDGAASGASSGASGSKRKFKDCYKVGELLGKGGFAVVKRVTERATGKQYAVKIMSLPPAGVEPSSDESTREDIFKEIDILCGLDHDNVVFFKEYFEEGSKVYVITELVTGGELLEAVIKRGAYSEAEARLCFIQLLQGIQYLHSRNVVHRDLKLENLLLATPDDMTKVKIADFGLAKRSAAGAMTTVCGTPQYVAPEVIQGTPGLMYGPQVDMWSAGVVLFILLAGYPPFYSESEPALFDQIRRGAFNFDDPAWYRISASAKGLIQQLLSVDSHHRLTATQCLQHDWIKAGDCPSEPLVGAHARLKQAYAISLGGEGFTAAMAAGRDSVGAMNTGVVSDSGANSGSGAAESKS